MEYIGPGARTISATGKATITNVGAELGATTSCSPMMNEWQNTCGRRGGAI